MAGCKSGWYESVFYKGDSFAVAQPSKLITCYQSTTTTTPSPSEEYATMRVKESATLVQITMFAGLLFLLFVMFRSYSRFKTDWYRLIGVYLIGTIGVPVSILLGPQHPGFNRIVGFGILVHNLAEVFIIGHVWFGNVNKRGHNRYGGIYTLLYVWVILTLIAFLPHAPLFLILMIQGAGCDWMLVATFVHLGRWMNKTGNAEHFKSDGGCMGCVHANLGLAAAIMHIVSIQPLFFSFATTLQGLTLFTVIALFPTFLVYIWFAAVDKLESPFIIQPNPSSRAAMDCDRNQLLVRILRKENEIELKQRSVVNPQEEKDDGAAADQTQIVNNDEYPKPSDRDGDRKKSYTYGDVVVYGLVNIDKTNGMKWFKILVGVTFSVSVANSLLVFFSPCYINMVPVVCD